MALAKKTGFRHSRMLYRSMSQALLYLRVFVCALLSGISFSSYANSYAIDDQTTVVGSQGVVLSKHDDTLYSLALQHQIGAAAFADANPDVDPLLPGEGVVLALPGLHILPEVEREGIVINLPEMRLYYFPEDEDSVTIYPVGIGRQGWETPVMQSVVTSITEDPVWTPPESIHKEYRAAGMSLPERVAAGPDNPLGKYAIRIGDTSYLIHGTNSPEGVGLRVSHGCIRLYSDHIAELASRVKVGTSVRIINQSIKLDRINGAPVIQAHRPLPGGVGDGVDKSRVMNSRR